MILANVVFPTFLFPYVSILLLPIIGLWILGSEIITAIILNRKSHRFSVSLAVFLTNLSSSLFGVLIGIPISFIPGEFNDINSERAFIYIWISYSVAFLISILIEGYGYHITKRVIKDENIKVWTTAWSTNLVSYAGIGAFWFLWHKIMI